MTLLNKFNALSNIVILKLLRLIEPVSLDIADIMS
jgi:hypothetical protein